MLLPTKTAQKQARLASIAIAHPEERFRDLYSLLHWRPWVEKAAQRVLARPGSSTAGVDSVTRADFEKRYEQQINHLIDSLKHKTYQPQPVRRTYIPKSNGRRRPLGIPVLQDRIVQEALRAILDPVYESDFQHHSYGFRKGRCTMDAVAVLMPLFNTTCKHYYVIEGDIRSYFDAVHHRKLMSLLRQRIQDKDILTLIWKFLKAGVMEGQLFAKTESGVPQGGIISPLLANVYLNEFDKWAEQKWHSLTPSERDRRRRNGLGNYTMVRYADDFVVVSNGTIAQVRESKEQIKEYLATELHLELSDEKTRITHVNDGFDFLGFHIQRVSAGGKWATHLRPKEEGKQRVKHKLKQLTSRNWTWMDEYTRLTTLNRIVRGWCEYYKYTSLVSDLEEIAWYAGARYFRWLRHKHPKLSKRTIMRSRYPVHDNRKRWQATIQEGDAVLTAYQWMPTRRELKRKRYRMKGRGGFPHPYLDERLWNENHPEWEGSPDESIYTANIGATSRPGEPLGLAEMKLRRKMHDGFQCVQCGSKENLQVHHTGSLNSLRLEDLRTLCQPCHAAEHKPAKHT